MEVQPWTRRLGLGIAVALLSACSGTLADAPIAREEIDPQVLGSWPMHGGGEPFSVATYQGYAYVSAGGIQYVDIRDPKRPRVTGGYPAPAFSRGDIVVSGRRLYSCQGNGGLVILDLTDPAQPTQVGLFRTDAQTVAADGNRVYVGTSDSVQFLDVSDVAHPRLFGGWRVPTPQPPVASIAISGRYAYLAAPFSGVWIIDADAVGGPKEFARIGLSSQLSQPWGVTVAGGLAYVADWQLGLVIFDVSDPSRPVARGKLATRSPAVQVVVSGSYAFVCEREDGVEIVDIRDPRRPVSIGRYDTPGEAWGINLQGTVACVADRMAGLQIFDLSQPSSPVRLGSVDTQRYSAGIAFAAPFAFLATDEMGLEVMDVSDPVRPMKVAGCEEARDAAAVVLAEDRRHAFVASYEQGVHVVDITEPLRPVRVAGWAVEGYVQGIIRTGSNVLVSIRDRGFQIVDVSNPIRPRVLHNGFARGTTVDARQVAVYGNFAYVVDYPRGVVIYDISDPNSPREIGSIPLPEVTRVAFAGLFAYAVADAGLVTLDVSDPAKPKVVETYAERLAFPAFDLLAVGDTLAMAANPGLQFFDLRNPRRPLLFGMAACGQASGIVHDGRHWMVSQIHGGLAIVDSHRGASMRRIRQERDLYGYWGLLGAEKDWLAVPDNTGQLRIARQEASGEIRDLGVLDSSFSVGSVLFHGNHLFGVRPGVAGALSVYETSGSTLPRLVASTNVIAYIADQAIEGNQLYVLAAGIGVPGRTPDPDGLLVFDISNPTRPARQGQYRLTGDPQALAVTNHLGYMAHGTNGLTVLDLANPEQIRVAGQIPAAGFSKHIVLAKGCAFVGTNADGVRIYDLSNPVAPRLLGEIQPGQDAASLAIVDDIAFVGSESIQAYDIRDPARPRPVGGYTTILQPKFTRQSFTADGDLMVASFQDGVCRLRLRPFFRSQSWTNQALSLDWYPTEGVRLEASSRSVAPQWSDLPSEASMGRATVPTEGLYRQFRLTRP